VGQDRPTGAGRENGERRSRIVKRVRMRRTCRCANQCVFAAQPLRLVNREPLPHAPSRRAPPAPESAASPPGRAPLTGRGFSSVRARRVREFGPLSRSGPFAGRSSLRTLRDQAVAAWKGQPGDSRVFRRAAVCVCLGALIGGGRRAAEPRRERALVLTTRRLTARRRRRPERRYAHCARIDDGHLPRPRPDRRSRACRPAPACKLAARWR
jgi:hypothetical protein